MARFVWFVLLVLVVVALWRGWRRRDRASPPPSSPSPSRARPANAAPAGLMVQCAHCGVHLDAQDAILARSKYYCSVAHLEAGDSTAAGR